MNVNYLVDDCYLYIPDVYETAQNASFVYFSQLPAHSVLLLTRWVI